ncbi:hypothetical protein BP6252_06310 [Coleophoma cylindrospora]|uniref:Uncharacterized protein n=1 Tax=Coleophoma cylindrospora TaxID=1849047 RepID=A0A3D8RMJ6_9HELO|nr:hypothetical protein BP6252_06310 [Coleophoma cylindrospora]
MPLERRPSLGGHHRSTSSITNTNDDSSSSTPPQHKAKGSKHVVGKHPHQIHARVPSSKGLHQHKHGGGSHTDLKKAATSSTNLKKNSSHVSLRRNRSVADVQKSRPKSSHGGVKRPTSVHFEIGSQGAAEAEDGWEEASSSASPALSRSASRIGSQQSSAKPSANNSQHHSPDESPIQKHQPLPANTNGRSSADARVITERLLQRTPSLNTTKMSLTTAKPTPTSLTRSHDSSLPNHHTPGGSSAGKDEVTSRFVNGGSSATPGEQSPFLYTAPRNHKNSNSSSSLPKSNGDEVKRAKSMANLTWHDSSNTENEESESALAPRSRKGHTATQSYVPAQQSRTQQKLWLQRASSNIEPQQAGAGTTMPGYEGRTAGTRAQLEKTGLEYLVVRRYQDPVGAALKRLALLPGNEKMRRIPAHANGPRKSAVLDDRSGLSQSLRDRRSGVQTPVSLTRRSSFEGPGSQGSLRDGDGEIDENAQALLRSIWEKNFEMSGSA